MVSENKEAASEMLSTIASEITKRMEVATDITDMPCLSNARLTTTFRNIRYFALQSPRVYKTIEEVTLAAPTGPNVKKSALLLFIRNIYLHKATALKQSDSASFNGPIVLTDPLHSMTYPMPVPSFTMEFTDDLELIFRFGTIEITRCFTSESLIKIASKDEGIIDFIQFDPLVEMISDRRTPELPIELKRHQEIHRRLCNLKEKDPDNADHILHIVVHAQEMRNIGRKSREAAEFDSIMLTYVTIIRRAMNRVGKFYLDQYRLSASVSTTI